MNYPSRYALVLISLLSFLALPQGASAQTWSAQYPQQPPAATDLEALSALDVWVAFQDGTLQHTTNGGVNWASVSPGASALAALQFQSGSLGWCAGDGIWRTSNAGQSWQQTHAANVRELSMASASQGAAVTTAGHVLTTTDGGLSWTDIGAVAGLSSPTDIQVLPSGHTWLTGAAGALFFSMNFGATWTLVSTGTSAQLTAVHFVNASQGWICAGADILRTTDGGAQWTPQTNPTGGVLHDLFFLTSDRGWAAGAQGAVLSTTNGGATWSAGSGAGSADLLAIDAVDFFTVWASGAAGSVAKSTSGGATWSLIAGGTSVPGPFVIGIDASDSLHAWAATFDSNVLRTQDGGANWVSIPCGVNYQWWDVSFFDDLNGYACGKRQSFFPSVAYTKDGGLSWNQIAFGLQMDWHDIEAIAPNVALVAGDTFVFRTTDGGLSWPSTTPTPLGTYYGMDFVDGQNGWIAGSEVFRTTDGGSTWTHLFTPSIAVWDVDFAKGQEPFTGWMVGEQGTVLKTVDSGATWSSSQIPGYLGHLLGMSVVDANTLWVTGDSAFVARSSDGGASWQVEQPAIPSGTQLRTIKFANPDKGWISGSHDIGVWGRNSDLPCPSPTVYCTAQTNSQGCLPAIASSGTASQSAGSGFTISASGLIAQTNGLFFYSKVGPDAAPFLGGTLCMQLPLVRTAPLSTGGSGACAGQAVLDFNIHIAVGSDPALVAGQNVWGQFWTRDPASASTTNLTNALQFVVCP